MKKIILSVISILIASALLVGCNDAEKSATKEISTKPGFDLSTAKKEIEEINKHFMGLISKADSVGISKLYTADAKLLFAGAPAVEGRANIQTALGRILNSGVTKAELKTKEVFGNEDLLAEEGEVVIYVKDNIVAVEKFIVLWKKENGKWMMLRDISNSNAPAPSSK